jgi:hypothetical protein
MNAERGKIKGKLNLDRKNISKDGKKKDKKGV